MFEFPMTTDRRKAVIDRLAKYLAPSESGISISNVYPLLRAELGQFVAQETASGNVRYAADVGCHDDLVMSLAISLWVLIEEVGDSSPIAATSEEAEWPLAHKLDMKSIREARQRAIDDMEESYRNQWESFSINSAMRGWNG
jgi:hypothetical protein